MRRVQCLSGLSLAAALLVASLGVAGVSFGAAGKAAPLADAVQRGDKATMLSLLRKQVDVNAAQGDGATALHWAVYVNDAETTALLIRADAKVNVPNNYGVTPLGLASKNGNAAIIEQLVKAGADPNDPLHAVNAGETPLMRAARLRDARGSRGERGCAGEDHASGSCRPRSARDWGRHGSDAADGRGD